MSSSIFFRFKSQKEPLQITFDGTSLSVFEVKRDIITLSRLGDGTDFDLEIYSADNNEKYDDDTTQIPRSSTVIARRLPASRPGAGRAARYVTGKMPVNAKNAHRIEPSLPSTGKGTPVANNMGALASGKEMTEEEKLQAILNANTTSWKAEQEANSHKPIIRSYNKPAAVPDKPLPPGYICHRCGEKGHWIQACPTNNDPSFDNRPKFRRTTGIPRSFLKVVEKPTEVGEDGKIDVSKLPQGVMYTATGEWVIAEPDKATWDKIQEKQNAAAEKAKEAAEGDVELRERGLECSLHKGPFVEPVKTPCCNKTYCRDCIENALLDGDLICPNCGEQVLLDKLEEDAEMVEKMRVYAEEKAAERKQKDNEASKSPPAAAGSPGSEAKSPSAVPEVKVNGITSSASTPNSTKRAAEDELVNDRKPANPASEAMKKSNSKQGTPQPNSNSANGTPKPVQPPVAPAADVAEFQKQMSAMAASMAGYQNGMPSMVNPMMGFNPAMMGMPMGVNPMMGMGPMGFGPGYGINGNGMNGWGGNQVMGNGGGNWQGNGGQRGGMQGGYGRGGNANGNQGPYMRQPVNPHRQRGRFNRQGNQGYQGM